MSEIFETEPEYGSSVGRVNLTAYTGSKWREIRLDASTRALEVISDAHHEVHGGSSFRIEVVEDVAANKSITNIFVTPLSTKEIHIIFSFEVEAESDIKIYEGVTASSSGTAGSIYNKNRISTTASASLFYSGAAISNTGTNLIIRHHPGSGKKVGGEMRGIGEWVLKSNTAYSIVVLNSTAGANQIDLELDWYEHIAREA